MRNISLLKHSIIDISSGPFELTKLSAQVSVLMADRKQSSISEPSQGRAVAASYQNKGTYKTAKNIVKHRGFVGLYSGFRLHLCKYKAKRSWYTLICVVRDTLGTSIYFATYESSKQLLTTYAGVKSTMNPIAIAVAGGLCGIASWALIYPIDSAKSIYQRNSLTHCKGEKAKKIPKIEFFNKRMYRGLGVSMGRSCVVNSIFFSAFEYIKKHVNALED